ncbi:putative multidrug resistance protein fnx1 [Hypoxylon sp. FL0543]|nr:putative multidrug resistance protein fnx1 [Hypoxylon sp. FL0543]
MEVEKTGRPDGHFVNGVTDPKLDVEEQGVDSVKEQSDVVNGDGEIIYIHGPRFWFISAALAIMMFLTNLEVPVVITALVAITDDLSGFENVGWIVASYLLGYVAVIVICAKFSDIFGRKLVFLLSTVIFVIFSAACSASQTMAQLIIFRAFQGVGGGGCWSLSTIIIVDLVPPEKYPKFVVPIAAPAFLIAIFAIPKGFPYHNQPNYRQASNKSLMGRATLSRIDIPGTILILFATLALTSAFEEADKRFPWRSAYVIVLLILSGLFWILLGVWERHVTSSNGVREPILPWRFIKNRQMMGILLNFVLLGGPTVICMFIMPQRFQLVYGTSGLDAGVRLIPFTVVIPVSSIFASGIAGKLKVPPLYLLIVGSCFQVLGFALLGTLPSTLTIPPRIYGFEILAGWGCGINFALLFIMIPWVNEKPDHAVAMGAGSQFRMMGGSIVLAIATSVFNTFARPKLQTLLGTSDTDTLVTFLPTLSQELQEQVRYVLAEGYNRQALVLCVSAALQVPASLLMWKKKQLRI